MISEIKNYAISYFIISIFLTISVSAQDKGGLSQSDRVEKYKSKYKVSTVYESITDNHGNNCQSVYGTRNMRAVLHGIVYRGGANNVYNKIEKRKNKNPMPEMGLKNLLNEGFSTAVYLYTTNFSDAKKIFGPDSNGNKLRYIQNSLSNKKEVRELLELVYQTINDPSAGPIYLHCWNGWHQSGYASALILMQFCNFSNEDAYNYWEKCAAGDLSNYKHIKKAILDFKPYDDFIVVPDVLNMICGDKE